MKINKKLYILLLFIIITGVFASFYGGSFAYALFYACFAVPVSCVLYVSFIYFRLKIHQRIETKVTVKGDKIPYNFILVNEDFIFFKEIRTEFLSDYSKIELYGLRQAVSLKAGERISQETELECLYRGEYKVGLKSVSFTDFLGLFTMSRKYPSEICVRVYPRVIRLNTLAALNFNEDAKIMPFSFSSRKETVDSELREYTKGDNPRLINWRASAGKGKLYVRKYSELLKENIEIFLDISPVNGRRGMKIALEDKILEAALAVSDFYLNNGIESSLNYCGDKGCTYKVSTPEGFAAFYDSCLELVFGSEKNTGEYITESIMSKSHVTLAVILTTEVGIGLGQALLKISSYGIAAAVILVGNYEAEELAGIRSGLQELKAKLVHIPEHGDISETLDSNVI